MKYKKKIIIAFFIAVGVACCLFYTLLCPKSTDGGIKPPFKELDIPYQVYFFSNDTAFTVYTETGTRVHIPANSIQLSGDSTKNHLLTLKLRELHNADWLFRSGIPMQVAGTNDFLQSAGMIDVSVYHDNVPAQIKEGQSIDIDLASFKDPNGYSLYYLENNRQWTVTDTFKIVNNRLKQRIRDSLLAIQMPAIDTTQPDKELIFDVYIDTINTPELKALYGLKWRISNKYIDAKLKDAMRVHWNKVRVETINKKKKQYKLVFERHMNLSNSQDSITKIFSVPAEPVLADKDIKNNRSKFKKQVAEFEATVEKLKKEEERLSKQSELVNQFKINKFGIWNIDRVTNEQDYFTKSVIFDFEKFKDVDPDGIIVYGLYKEINTVIPYKKSEWKQIKFPVNGNMRLIAVITDKTAAIVESSEIRSAVLNKETTISLSTNKISVNKISWQ